MRQTIRLRTSEGLHLIGVWVLLVLLFLVCGINYTSADLTSCSANISPSSTAPGSDTSGVFGIYNSSDTAINWVKISSPGAQYASIESGSAYQWPVVDTTDISATFSMGSMNSNDSRNFSVKYMAGVITSSAVSWIIQVSSDAGGSNPITCGGDLSMNIVNPPTVIGISNIGVSNVSSNSITITWDTDAASTSQINYGYDSDYGAQSNLSNGLVTSHSVVLTGLVSNTGYHFQVISTTPDGGSTSSGDNTFLTAVEPAVVIQAPSIPPVLVVPVTSPSDKIIPTISVTSILPKVVQVIPKISGVASDNVTVARLEYSTDGGLNWLPVDSTTSLDSKLASFSFTPSNLSDGNYKFMVRAFDGGGNVATTPAINVVVDRLPPIIGGIILSTGPQLLLPNNAGTFTSIVNIDQKITLSAVGGPTSINLVAEKIGTKTAVSQVFTLTESADTGLWSGIVSFTSSGKYNLTSIAIDGAGNKTSQKIGVIDVSSDPFTYSLHTKKPVKSTVSLYYFEPLSSTWVLWDGSSYGQSNPQTTSSKGTFQLFLPKGKYYLKATSTGYKPLVSSIFTSDQSQPFTTNIGMKSSNGINIGPIHLSWPSINMQKVKLPANPDAQLKSSKNELIGKVLPDFNLINTNGDTVTATSLLGRPTLVTIGSTWSPLMSEQLTALANLQANKDVNIVPIALQETAGKVKAYISIAGLSLTWLVDPDSSISPEYGTPYSPTNYFVDRDGVIKQVVVGVMSQAKIEEILGSL